ncbi:MAG: preprotein translocase subunit YajC [Selenomonadaceae bacterium]|nr:preprotein translocase subunit YajC [Selenomonadaceae bacterium]MBR1581046.1 preprotein translocase subunit YajC [Selenomonadaceae bacterium]
MDAESTAAFAAWGPIIVMLIIFYFMLYRPQKNAQRQREEMLNSLKVGNDVITIGGIYGKIAAIDETTLMLKIADNVEIKVARGSVNSVVVDEN